MNAVGKLCSKKVALRYISVTVNVQGLFQMLLLKRKRILGMNHKQLECSLWRRALIQVHSQPKTVISLERSLSRDLSFSNVFCSNAYLREELCLGTN